MDRFQRLRSWIYLRGPVDEWQAVGFNEPKVMHLPEERLKVVALMVILCAARKSKEKARQLAIEFQEIGYSDSELEKAKNEIDVLLTKL